MHPIISRRLALARARPCPPPKTFDPKAGLWYHSRVPVRYFEPNCERISRVQGEKFEALVESIREHGLANPLLTVSVLPQQNLEDWREWRLRWLYSIAAPLKIVVGHNRYAAIRALGWTHVPVLHSGPVAPATARLKWHRLSGLGAAQSLLRDGTLGLGPYSLEMAGFTPPLRGMPEGF